jgi:hypothetical protein
MNHKQTKKRKKVFKTFFCFFLIVCDPKGRETIIDIFFHVAAPRQHERKCRDVERPPSGGVQQSSAQSAVMSRGPSGRVTIIDALRRDVVRPFGPHNSHRLLDVMFRTPPKGGCETIIDPKGRDVERPPKGGCETIIDILLCDAAERHRKAKYR